VIAAGALALAVILGLLAVMSPLLAIGATLGLAYTAVALTSLTAGVCVLTLLSFFENLPGVQDSAVSPVKFAGAVLVIAWLLVIASREGRDKLMLRDRPVVSYAAALLVVWSLASRLWAQDEGATAGTGLRLALSVIVVFIVYTAVRDTRDMRWVIWAFIAGAFFSAIVGLATTSPEAATASAGEGRLSGGIADPNELAAVLVPALVLAAFSLAAVTGALARWALTVAVATFAICLFLTESRGGLVALTVVLITGVFLAGRYRPQAIALGLVIAGLGVAYYTQFATAESLQRVTGFFAGGGTGRTDLWSVALQMIRDHPLLGVGAGNFQTVEPTYAYGTLNLASIEFIIDTPKVAHNTALEILAETGIVGFAAFSALIVGCLARVPAALRAFAQADDVPSEALGRGLAIGIIGMLAALMFISGQYEKQLWLLLGLAAALGSIARTDQVHAE